MYKIFYLPTNIHTYIYADTDTHSLYNLVRRAFVIYCMDWFAELLKLGLNDRLSLEESLDPTKELARLIAERKLEEAFNKALALTNVGIVSWLCNQVNYRMFVLVTNYCCIE